MKIVATTSLPAVDRPNADRSNAARSRQNNKSMTYPLASMMDEVLSSTTGKILNKHSHIFAHASCHDMSNLR